LSAAIFQIEPPLMQFEEIEPPFVELLQAEAA
jgi:hypothetical protein